ncbi:unnamed protein product [Arctogadus glacialis]
MAAKTDTKNTTGKPSKHGGKESKKLIIAKTPAEEQRLKLERLMRNPDKPAPIPERPRDWNPRAPPEFVRDVMGSSAGAGSGEFHVYRHLRRREYQRQDFLDKMSDKVKQDIDYLDKVEDNKKAADDRTAKRRKKRDKLKMKKMSAKKAKEDSTKEGDEKSSSSSSDDDDDDKEAEDDAEAPSFPPPLLEAGREKAVGVQCLAGPKACTLFFNKLKPGLRLGPGAGGGAGGPCMLRQETSFLIDVSSSASGTRQEVEVLCTLRSLTRSQRQKLRSNI